MCERECAMEQLAKRWLKALQNASQGLVSEHCFQTGVDEDALNALEQLMGMPLPEDFKQWYRVFNGDNPDVQEFYYLLAGHEWLSAEQILQTWLEWDEAGLNDGMEMMTEDYANDEGILPVMWAKKWLPFANDNGYFLLLDLEPAPTGHYGQVLGLSGDGDPTILLAPSIKVWLEQYVTDIENGVWVFDVESRGMVLATDLAEYRAINHEKATQTGRFDPVLLTKQKAQMQALEDQLIQAIGTDMWQMLSGMTKK